MDRKTLGEREHIDDENSTTDMEHSQGGESYPRIGEKTASWADDITESEESTESICSVVDGSISDLNSKIRKSKAQNAEDLDFIHSASSIGSARTIINDGSPSSEEESEYYDTVRNLTSLRRNSVSTTNLPTVFSGSHRSIYTSIVLMPENGAKWNQLAERDSKISKFCVIPVLEDQMSRKAKPGIDWDASAEIPSNDSSLDSNNPVRYLLAKRAIAMQSSELSPVMEMPFGSAADINQSLRDIRKAKDSGQPLPDKSTLRRTFLLQCLSFLFVYTGYVPIRGIQTSLNHHQNLGSISVSIIFASCVFGSVICPILVQRYGPKRTICVSLLAFLVYAIGNLYASFYTLIPASIVFGIGFSCLLGAQGAYQTDVAATYSTVTQTKIEKILPFFGGIYFTFLQFANIAGNGLGSTILKVLGPIIDPEFYIHTHELNSNETNFTEVPPIYDNEKQNCGAEFANVFVNSSKFLVSPKALYTLLGIMIVLTLAGIVICTFFVERLDCIFKRRKKSLWSHLKTVFSYHRDLNTWLLLCLAMYSAFRPSLLYGDIVKAFVTCPIGLDMIGYAIVCYATGSALMASSSGHISKLIGPQVLQCLGFMLSACLYTTMLLWQPEKDKPYLIFAMFCFLGINDAVYQTKYYSMVGSLYAGRTETAFSFFLMYQSTVCATVFAASPLLRMGTKLYLGLTFLCVTVMSYSLLMLRLKREQKIQEAAV